jgi:Ca2+-binding EF-hand superfamily protein
MNNTKMMMFATAIMLCLAATVMAQPPGGGRGGQGRGGPGGERGGRGGERGGPGGDMGRMMQMMPIMVALDADKDGVISKTEIDNAAVALRKLDKNDDGELDAEELRPKRPEGGRPERGGEAGGRGGRGGRGGEAGGRGGRGGEAGGRGGEAGRGAGARGGSGEMVERMMAMDKNNDGKISKEEAPERMKTMFDRVDSDSDGFIDKSEIEAMAARVGGRGGAGGRGGEGGAGRGDGGGQKPKRPSFDEDK